MYFPSTSIDGEFVFNYEDKEWLDPDSILSNEEFQTTEIFTYDIEAANEVSSINKDIAVSEAILEFTLDECGTEENKDSILDVQPSKSTTRKKENPKEKDGLV